MHNITHTQRVTATETARETAAVVQLRHSWGK